MMAIRQPLFGGGLRADPETRAPLGDHEPANETQSEEAGAQRGAIHPGDPNLEVDLLDDDVGRRPGGWRSGVAIVAALAIFVGILWYAYDWGMGQLATTRLPVIVADSTPIKSRPETPGGLEVLNQDVAVLNDPAPSPELPQAERLLPPPEMPQPPQAEAPQAESLAKVEELLGPPLETAAGPPDAPQVAAAGQPEAAPEPVLPEPKAEVQLAPELPAVPPVAPVAATAAPAPQVAATAAPAPQVAALPDAKTGGFVVQLAALRAKEAARPAWARMQKAHPALLGSRELAIQEVDLGDRGIFYRVQAGFFADRAGARDTCNALKARGQDCLVVKR
jgi:hypothetical protein